MNKSILNQFIDMFSKLSTAIFFFSSIYIAIFVGFDGGLSVSYIWGVLALSFIICLARLPFCFDKEMTKKKYILWNVFFFIFANIVVLVFGFLLGWFNLKAPATIIGMEITYIAVSIVIWVLICMSMKHSADKMNQQLKKIKN
ncbi:MAG: DUF3021 family protein [Treponema sp.]|nr:DUF3021 family protein [Treponema sp.]